MGRSRSGIRSCAARELQRTTAFCNRGPHELREPNHCGIETIVKKLKLQCTQQKREETDSNKNFRCLENIV